MKKIRRKRSAVFVLLLISGLAARGGDAFADVHMKARMLGGMSASDSWLSGDKQRSSVQLPMAGEVVTIVRLDKGVQWTLLPGRQVYEEKSLALAPGESPMDMPGLPSAGKPQAQGMPQGFGLDCVPEVRKVPEKKSFAGFEAEGFEIACPGEPQTMTLWMASGGALAQAEKETAAFFKSMAEKQYANYPEAERQEILKNIEKLGAAYSMMRLPDMKDLPENGMLVAMEAGGLGQASSPNGSMLIYEIAEVDTRKADPSLFEIPEGYTRVGSIEQEMTQQIMGGSGLGAFAQMFQDAASQGGSADPSYPGAQADLPPPGMVRRPGPNGWEYVPAGETEQVRPAGVPAAPVSGTAGASGRSEGEEEAPPGMIRKPGPNGWVYVPASEA